MPPPISHLPTCKVFQRTTSKKPVPGSLIPLLFIEVPFTSVMDLIGSLPKSAQGHKHILGESESTNVDVYSDLLQQVTSGVSLGK